MSSTKNKSHLTAISRNALPLPTRWLIKNNLITGRTLDYGCGKCAPINPADWDNYDPHYYPSLPSFLYDTIICNYVLCTIPSFFERMNILRKIQSYLTSNGVAFISVRNDKPRSGWGLSVKGTYQCRLPVIPPLTQIYANHSFRVFDLTPRTKLV